MALSQLYSPKHKQTNKQKTFIAYILNKVEKLGKKCKERELEQHLLYTACLLCYSSYK